MKHTMSVSHMTHPTPDARTVSRRGFAISAGAALASLGLPGRASASTPANWALSADFLGQLHRLMELAAVPGLAMAIVRDSEVAWTRAAGVRSAATKDPVTEDTIFPAASLGKPVFAYAVLRMRDEGLIDLDRPVAAYLTLADAGSDERTRAVTARHVLSHSTGFPNWRNKRDQQLTSDFVPGDRFGYSGEGFVYLQRAVERIIGLGIEAIVQEWVLAPLGMRQSSYFWRPGYDARIVTGHSRGQPAEGRKLGRRLYEHAAKGPHAATSWTYDEMVRALAVVEPPLAPLPNFIVPNVAGSLLTTAGDYGRFLARVVGAPRGDGLDLQPETRREMLSPRTRINEVLSWGLGWGLERDAGREYVWHWGDNGDFKNFTIAEPARRAGLVVLANSSTGMRLCERVVNAATGHEHPAFLWV